MTSFPFLKIARDFGIPYEDVLLINESFDVPMEDDLSLWQEMAFNRSGKGRVLDAIIDARQKEEQRREDSK